MIPDDLDSLSVPAVERAETAPKRYAIDGSFSRDSGFRLQLFGILYSDRNPTQKGDEICKLLDRCAQLPTPPVEPFDAADPQWAERWAIGFIGTGNGDPPRDQIERLAGKLREVAKEAAKKALDAYDCAARALASIAGSGK